MTDLSLETLGTEISKHYETFLAEHKAFIEKGNKAASARARKALQELKQCVTPYRKSSVELQKSMKKNTDSK
jgi:hypothetical protein